MTLRIIVVATLFPIVVVVAAIALYFALGWRDSGIESGRLMFVSDQDGDGEIDPNEEYVMNADGSGVTPMNHNEAGGGGIDFVRSVMHEDGSSVTLNEAKGGDTSQSPDELRVFASDRDGDFEIYVMNPDESGVILLAHNAMKGEYEYQTPQGIVSFTSGTGGFETYLAQSYGSGVKQLTHNEADDSYAFWAPDGRISFISDRDGDREIYVMNSDGSGVTQLTHNGARDSTPYWSPDGRRIAFSSDLGGDVEIYVMNPDGSGVTQLTHNEIDDYVTGWFPAPSATP